MHRPILPIALLCGLFLSTACSTVYTQLPSEDRSSLERQLTGKDAAKNLRLSVYVTPFFGDGTKKLLTPLPPEEVQLITHPNGEAVNPGPIEKVLPAGTHVRIKAVEFPTAFAVTERIPYTPRHMTWVYLTLDGEPADRTYVLCLRPTAKTQAEFLGDLERYLTHDEPTRLLSDYTETVKAAIREKNAVVDMPGAALEMAWGYPERKKKWFEESNQNEEWSYPGGKRTAYLTNGRVTRVVGPGTP
jgi:hypothetical protein